jgi:ubiquinone/menaquinone biosynthesis C-methylase UbiE
MDRLHGFDGKFEYVRCTNCNLVYMNPQIAFENISKFYPDDYAPHKLKPYKIKKHKMCLYLNPRTISKITKKTKVLDVGCGSGKFLAKLKKLTDCDVYGLDLSKNAVNAARQLYNLNIFQGTISDLPYNDNSFDIITAWSYIEHVNNPSDVLTKMNRLLKKNGDLILKTPNIDSFTAKIFKDKWYHLDCPRHLFLFSPNTIEKMLINNGFKITSIQFDNGSKGILASMQYLCYSNNYEIENKNRIRKSKLIKNLVSPLAKILGMLKKSDTFTVYAKKIN